MSANTSSSSSSASGSVLVTATVSLPRSGGGGDGSSSSSESPSVTTFEIRRDVSAAAAGETVDATPYSFEFTGKHDDGSLPAAGSGYYAHLVDSLLEAKIAIDSVLKLEAAKEKISNPVGAPPKKKRKDGASASAAAEDAEEDVDVEDGGDDDDKDAVIITSKEVSSLPAKAEKEARKGKP